MALKIADKANEVHFQRGLQLQRSNETKHKFKLLFHVFFTTFRGSCVMFKPLALDS